MKNKKCPNCGNKVHKTFDKKIKCNTCNKIAALCIPNKITITLDAFCSFNECKKNKSLIMI